VESEFQLRSFPQNIIRTKTLNLLTGQTGDEHLQNLQNLKSNFGTEVLPSSPSSQTDRRLLGWHPAAGASRHPAASAFRRPGIPVFTRSFCRYIPSPLAVFTRPESYSSANHPCSLAVSRPMERQIHASPRSLLLSASSPWRCQTGRAWKWGGGGGRANFHLNLGRPAGHKRCRLRVFLASLQFCFFWPAMLWALKTLSSSADA
jgi:hypothetical protein